MSENAEKSPVVVVGAGIGGLTAALALARRGLPVEVCEKRTSRTVELAGTGMTIWSNATTALSELGLAEALKENGQEIRTVRNVSRSNDVVFETDVAGLEWSGSHPSVSIARGALVRILLEACQEQGVVLRFGAGCEKFTSGPDAVEVELSDGGRIRASALIGADGVRSRVRSQLFGDGDPDYYGISVWRGVSESSGGIDKGLVHMWQTREPSGLAGMAWHVDDERVAWTIGMKAPAGQKDAPGTLKKRVLSLVEDVEGPARRYVEDTPDDGVIRVDLYSRDTHKWGEGLVTLLGDAGHAMPTVLGQGACQAIEDAAVLGECLEDARDMGEALRTYERRRDERVRWMRGQVGKLARMQQWSNPLMLRMRDMAARHIAPRVQPKMWHELLRPPVATPGLNRASGRRP